MAEKKYVYPFDEAYGLGKELLDPSPVRTRCSGCPSTAPRQN